MSAEAIQLAIDAGFDAIEHGTSATPEHVAARRAPTSPGFPPSSLPTRFWRFCVARAPRLTRSVAGRLCLARSRGWSACPPRPASVPARMRTPAWSPTASSPRGRPPDRGRSDTGGRSRRRLVQGVLLPRLPRHRRRRHRRSRRLPSRPPHRSRRPHAAHSSYPRRTLAPNLTATSWMAPLLVGDRCVFSLTLVHSAAPTPKGSIQMTQRPTFAPSTLPAAER
jgi:hypothetical protein